MNIARKIAKYHINHEKPSLAKNIIQIKAINNIKVVNLIAKAIQEIIQIIKIWMIILQLNSNFGLMKKL